MHLPLSRPCCPLLAALLLSARAAGGQSLPYTGGIPATPVSFGMYRFSVHKTREPQNKQCSGGVQLSEFVFGRAGGHDSRDSGGLKRIGVKTENPGGPKPGSKEGCLATVDGMLSTKWFDHRLQPVIIDFTGVTPPPTYDQFSWATANDCPSRDAIGYALEGSDDGHAWHMLLNKTFQPGQITQNRQVVLPFQNITHHASSDEAGKKACGGGCAFLILFFVGGFVYVAAGFAYNFRRLDKRGLEAVPHVEFWKDFPSLVKDGMVFSAESVNRLARKGYTSV